jgi:hypothetical protein
MNDTSTGPTANSSLHNKALRFECAYLIWPHRDYLFWPHSASGIGGVRAH